MSDQPPKGLTPGLQKSGKYKGKFIVQAFGGAFGEYIGWIALPTHSDNRCFGQGCVIHHPSAHGMRDWPLYWRGDRGLMERACKHGVGHPDPDDLAFKATRFTDDDPNDISAYRQAREERNYSVKPAFTAAEKLEAEAVHGCDFCCHTDVGQDDDDINDGLGRATGDDDRP